MTMHTDSQAERPIENSRPAGPGGQLRQARLDLKLAPEDVAHILHLSSRQIVALENDDYDKLPGPTYVRGYLRGYSQLLGLAAEPVVETYNRMVASRKPIDLGKLAAPAEIRRDHQLIKLVTVAVVVIVLGLSAVWWHDQPTLRVQPTTLVPTTQESRTSDAESTVPATSALDTEPVVPVPAAPDVSPRANPAKPPESAISAAAPAPAVVNVVRGRLVLRAQSESWVEVRYGQGNRLLYETIAAGRTVTVEGETPIAVFLGNAPGVQAEFNGQTFDVGRYTHGEIARFTLGTSARTP